MQDQRAVVAEQEADGRPALKLLGEMSPLGAAELHRVALELADRGQDVLVGCQELQSLDLTSLQILVALKEALAARGHAIELAGLSAEVAETIALAGLGEALGLARPAAALSTAP